MSGLGHFVRPCRVHRDHLHRCRRPALPKASGAAAKVRGLFPAAVAQQKPDWFGMIIILGGGLLKRQLQGVAVMFGHFRV